MLIATFPLLRISFRKSSSPYALVSSMLSLTSPPRFSFLLLRLAYSHLATLFLTAPLYCCVYSSRKFFSLRYLANSSLTPSYHLCDFGNVDVLPFRHMSSLVNHVASLITLILACLRSLAILYEPQSRFCHRFAFGLLLCLSLCRCTVVQGLAGEY